MCNDPKIKGKPIDHSITCVTCCKIRTPTLTTVVILAWWGTGRIPTTVTTGSSRTVGRPSSRTTGLSTWPGESRALPSIAAVTRLPTEIRRSTMRSRWEVDFVPQVASILQNRLACSKAVGISCTLKNSRSTGFHCCEVAWHIVHARCAPITIRFVNGLANSAPSLAPCVLPTKCDVSGLEPKVFGNSGF